MCRGLGLRELCLQDLHFLPQIVCKALLSVELIRQTFSLCLELDVRGLFLKVCFLESFIALPVHFVFLQYDVMILAQNLNGLLFALIGRFRGFGRLCLLHLPELVDLLAQNIVFGQRLLEVALQLVDSLALLNRLILVLLHQ